MSSEKPLVGVVMGSTSDADIMEGCVDVLKKLNVPHEVKVISAHRTPARATEYAKSAAERGIEAVDKFRFSGTILKIDGDHLIAPGNQFESLDMLH